MANEQNLKPWKAGQSGNPAGKPPGRNRKTIIRELLDAAHKGTAGTNADGIAAALLVKALKGDVAAFHALFDSAYGKMTDKVESQHTYTKMGYVMISENGEPEKPLIFNVGSPVRSEE